MRPLWPIEREILRITALEYPASAEAIVRQLASARVVNFENSGAGFFSDLEVAAETPPIQDRSPLEGAHGNVLGLEHGMAFIVFLKNGRLSMIEGYCNGDVSTDDLDFSKVVFGLMPWTPKPQAEA
jgi:hypothetical protein